MIENYKLIFECENGGKVFIHLTHNANEITENLFFAKILASYKFIIHLLPYAEDMFRRNPDAAINGRIADFKHPHITKNLHNSIQTHIRNANKQGVAITVFYFEKLPVDRTHIVRGLTISMQDGWNRNIQEIWLIYPDKSLYIFKRSEIKDRSFIKKLP